MKKVVIGILDYGVGNTSSVRSSLSALGYRHRLVDSTKDLNLVNGLIIPGVGAFPNAMKQLIHYDLVEPVKQFAKEGKGIVGICLGMQLLADISYEQGETRGLGLIPGEVKAICEPHWHIGWNALNVVQLPLLTDLHGDNFYFNHAYEFCTQQEYIAGVSHIGRPLASVVYKDNIYGFQFHPEKSQLKGLQLMDNVMNGLVNGGVNA